MGFISIAAQLILSLSILVVLHECGHFFPAKWFKTRVEKFYLFFNPGFSLFKKQIGETEYGIGWIPFGGYVKISGMIDESMDTEQMAEEPKDYEFRSKPAWQRLIIMLGGVTVNFILGILIFAGMFWYFGSSYVNSVDVKDGVYTTELGRDIGMQDGDKVLSIGEYKFEKFHPPRASQEIILNTPKNMVVERNGEIVKLPIPADMARKLTTKENKGVGLFGKRFPQKTAEVSKSSPADKAGLKVDDRIISVDGKSTAFFNEFNEAIKDKKNSTIIVQALRNGTDTISMNMDLGEDGKLGVLSVVDSKEFFPIQRDKYSLTEAFPKGADRAWGFLTGQLKAFKKMFSNEINAADSVGSIISIGNMFDASWDWEVFWNITAMLSILLGFFNLLPIPALDGGYVMFLLWEVITGKKPNDKFMEYATIGGFFILIALMIFALGNDIRNLIWP